VPTEKYWFEWKPKEFCSYAAGLCVLNFSLEGKPAIPELVLVLDLPGKSVRLKDGSLRTGSRLWKMPIGRFQKTDRHLAETAFREWGEETGSKDFSREEIMNALDWQRVRRSDRQGPEERHEIRMFMLLTRRPFTFRKRVWRESGEIEEVARFPLTDLPLTSSHPRALGTSLAASHCYMLRKMLEKYRPEIEEAGMQGEVLDRVIKQVKPRTTVTT
jgi:hypothetical protein